MSQTSNQVCDVREALHQLRRELETLAALQMTDTELCNRKEVLQSTIDLFRCVEFSKFANLLDKIEGDADGIKIGDEKRKIHEFLLTGVW